MGRPETLLGRANPHKGSKKGKYDRKSVAGKVLSPVNRCAESVWGEGPTPCDILVVTI